MKKTRNYFWLLKPNVNFRKLPLTVKIVTLLLFCGLVLPAFSLNAETFSGNTLPKPSDDQQQIKVTGTIIDASTILPMPGVNIMVKGTNIGAIADQDGKFTLTVTDPNARLVFSFTNYLADIATGTVRSKTCQ